MDQKSNNQRIAKNTLLLYIRMLLTMSISLYTSRIVLDTLGEVDFGIYNVVGGFVSMFVIISGAMTTATQRFLSFEIGKGAKGNVKALFSTAIMIHFFLAFIILILAETIGLWFLNTHMNFPANRYVAANWVFQFSILTFIINVISVPYNAAIVAYERMKAFAYVSIVDVTLKLLVVYLLVISTSDKLIVYTTLLALIAITIRIIYGIYCKRNFPLCKCNFKWDKSHSTQMFSFVSWNLIGSIAGVAKEQGINVLLNIYFGATINAARGIAQQILTATTGFVNNFQLAMNPQIVKMYASEEKANMFKLVFRGSKYSFIMLLFLSLPVIFEAPFILNIWLMEVPAYTVIFLRLILLTALVDSLSGTLITSMHASGKVRDYQIVVGGLSLLTLPITWLALTNGFPPYSAMIIGLCISFFCHFARLTLLNKTIGLPAGKFLRKVTFKSTSIATLSAIIPFFVYINVDDSWSSFFLVCCITCLSTLAVVYSYGLTKNERVFIIGKVKIMYQKTIKQ
jgi:O-antigen/teichoic acid export membrane protein|uniref:lipopolysaccharide biosynthesis protein n=1 Tax=Bacteroides eggerthii TaxID=28111 RepID=UPI003FF0B968